MHIKKAQYQLPRYMTAYNKKNILYFRNMKKKEKEKFSLFSLEVKRKLFNHHDANLMSTHAIEVSRL